MKMSARGRLWLKSVHIIFSVVLLGGAVCIILLRAMNWSEGAHLHALDYAILLIEQGIIIPAATGALITGFLESWLTSWGFIRYRWVIVKWVVLIACVLIGTFWLGPWASQLVQLTETQGAGALTNADYLQARLMHTILFSAQTLALAALPFISVIKPWMRQSAARRAAPLPIVGRITYHRSTTHLR